MCVQFEYAYRLQKVNNYFDNILITYLLNEKHALNTSIKKPAPGSIRLQIWGTWAHPPPPMGAGLLRLIGPKNKKGMCARTIDGSVRHHPSGPESDRSSIEPASAQDV